MPPKIKLTKTTVEDLTYAEKGKQIDYFDSDLDGFGMRVSHTGKKYFVRRTIAAKRVRVMIGSHPVKTAEAARREAKIVLGVMESGVDPNELKKEKVRSHQAEQLEITISALVDRYIEQHAKVEKKTWMEDKRCLEKDVVPIWGKRKAKDIRKRDVVDLLDKIKERAPVMANNTFEKIRKMFNFAVGKDILEISPCYMVRKPTKTESKDRTLSANEICEVWFGLNRTGMTDEMKRAIKLILVTGQRPGEVIGLHSREVEGSWWTVPKERSKNGREHRVFLTLTALELIGDKQGYIFESPRGDKGIHVNAVAYAVRRNLEDATKTISEKAPVVQKKADGEIHGRQKLVMQSWTPHDLRRTAATKISELGYNDEIVDAILNHVKRGDRRTYIRNKYDKEKKRALTSWERRLKTITVGWQSAAISEVQEAIVGDGSRDESHATK